MLEISPGVSHACAHTDHWQGEKPTKNGLHQDFPGGPVLRLHAPIAGSLGSIPGWGTKMHDTQLGLKAKIKEKKKESLRPVMSYPLDLEVRPVP